MEDIKFYPVLLNYPSNFDEIREQTRKNVIYFKRNDEELHGDLDPFLNGQIFLLVHGYNDSINSNVRIFGIGELSVQLLAVLSELVSHFC